MMGNYPVIAVSSEMLRGCARAMGHVRLAALDQLNQTLWPQVKYIRRLDQHGKWDAVDVYLIPKLTSRKRQDRSENSQPAGFPPLADVVLEDGAFAPLFCAAERRHNRGLCDRPTCVYGGKWSTVGIVRPSQCSATMPIIITMTNSPNLLAFTLRRW